MKAWNCTSVLVVSINQFRLEKWFCAPRAKFSLSLMWQMFQSFCSCEEKIRSFFILQVWANQPFKVMLEKTEPTTSDEVIIIMFCGIKRQPVSGNPNHGTVWEEPNVSISGKVCLCVFASVRARVCVCVTERDAWPPPAVLLCDDWQHQPGCTMAALCSLSHCINTKWDGPLMQNSCIDHLCEISQPHSLSSSPFSPADQ